MALFYSTAVLISCFLSQHYAALASEEIEVSFSLLASLGFVLDLDSATGDRGAGLSHLPHHVLGNMKLLQHRAAVAPAGKESLPGPRLLLSVSYRPTGFRLDVVNLAATNPHCERSSVQTLSM